MSLTPITLPHEQARISLVATPNELVVRAVRALSKTTPLGPAAIVNTNEIAELSTSSEKRIVKALIDAARNFRSLGHLGKLRVALLIGVTLYGGRFLTPVERAGVLLGDREAGRKFIRFYEELVAETGLAQDQRWHALHKRLQTYLAYQQLLNVTATHNRSIARILRVRPRQLIRMSLATASLSFLRKYFQISVPAEFEDLIDELGTPEAIASIASFLVVLANQYFPLDSLDFALPGLGDLGMKGLRELMIHGKTVVEEFEAGKYVSLFCYALERATPRSNIFRLVPPSLDFEYYLRLGYIRSQMNEGMARVDVAAKGKAGILTLQEAAERFAEEHEIELGEIRDKNSEWRRLRFNMPSIPSLYRAIKSSVFYEDLLSEEQLSRDFLIPFHHLNLSQVKLSENLDLETFYGTWRYFNFACLVDIALLRAFTRQDSTILLNSIVRAFDQAGMEEFVEALGVTRQQAKEFLESISIDVKANHRHLDLQYHPALRIAQTFIPNESRWTPREMVYLPSLLATSNIARNIQSAGRFRLELNAEAFVYNTVQTLRTRFPKVGSNKAIKGKAGATDIDVVIFEKHALYLFECKHSLPPAGPHEMRDIWEEIEKGIDQLQKALTILGDPARRQSYLAGWFPGTKPEDTVDLKIVACVLCSHRVFSGLQHRGFPIRDFSSLARLCNDGIVGMGEEISEGNVVMRQYRIIASKILTSADLDNYLSQDSTLFRSFAPFMHPVTRIEKLGEVAIAKETFVYEVELGAWSEHMESLGCVREPDKRQQLKPASSADRLAK